MDIILEYESTNDSPIFFVAHLFLSILGFLFYIISFLSLQFCYSAPSLIKKEIFIFILLNSFESLVEIIFTPSMKKEIFIYFFGIIKFYLIILFLNKCFTSRKISLYNSSFKLEHINLSVFLFMIISFPFEKCFFYHRNIFFLKYYKYYFCFYSF